MTLEDARAYDARKENGPYSKDVALKRAILWNVIKRYLPQDQSLPILDLGGGTGVWAISVAQEGYDVLLTDASPGFLARAEEKIDALGLAHKVTILQVDMDDLSRFEDNAFPLALALGDPLSYCRDAERALREIRRITKPGGVLIADVENRYGGIDERRAGNWHDVRQVLIEGIASWPGLDSQATIRLFAPSEAENLARSTGWEVLSIYPSDLLSALLDRCVTDRDRLKEVDLATLVAIEEHLREDQHLLGCGREIQFVLANPC